MEGHSIHLLTLAPGSAKINISRFKSHAFHWLRKQAIRIHFYIHGRGSGNFTNCIKLQYTYSIFIAFMQLRTIIFSSVIFPTRAEIFLHQVSILLLTLSARHPRYAMSWFHSRKKNAPCITKTRNQWHQQWNIDFLIPGDCPYGNVFGADGCPKCECRENPCHVSIL